MVELYFVFIRIPRMMSQLARERGRSAILWSIAAIVSWFFAEIAVFLFFGILYGIGTVALGWPEQQPPVLNVVAYVFGLGSAIASFALLRYILRSRPILGYLAPTPPPPPTFTDGPIGG